MIAKINTDLKRAPLNNFKEDPHNARRHPSRNMEAIKKSLTAYGQQKPIVVDKDNVIIAGNGTWRAAKELGWQEIGFSYYDGPAHKARAFAIADNRAAELAEWDTAVLQDELHGMAPEDWGDCGWSVDEVRNTTGSLPSNGQPTGDAGLARDGAQVGRTPEDKIDTFLHNTVRQVVLIYPEAEVVARLAQLEQVCKDQGLESNTDAVNWLLDQYMAAKQG